MKTHKKKIIFICQISEAALKVVKCAVNGNSKKEFIAVRTEPILPQMDDKAILEKLNQIVTGMGYNNDSIVISFSRNNASCRYLKIPSVQPKEIEKIISLQASRYLPYPGSELITGYQVVRVDKAGFSHVNLIIAHKNQIERYLEIQKKLKGREFQITLSSYGLSNFYFYLRPEDKAAVMVLDADSDQVELAVVSDKKLTFSRSFKLNQKNLGWERLLIEEINKSRDLYAKEVSKEELTKIAVMGLGGRYVDIAAALGKEANLSVEILTCGQKINLTKDFIATISDSDSSFISLMGLALGNLEDSLQLLPKDIKDKMGMASLIRQRLRRSVIILSIFFILSLAAAKNFGNKQRYLKQLKVELNKITQDASPLEEIEKRMQAAQKRLRQKPSALDIFSDLHKAVPPGVSLVNFNYEEGEQVILRGQSASLNSVFEFVSGLGKSDAFKNFSIKVRYATKRNTKSGELIDFEIGCLKKK